MYVKIKKSLRDLLEDEQAMFRIKTTVKLISIPMISLFLYLSILFPVLKIQFIFIEANDLLQMDNFQGILVDSLFSRMTNAFTYTGIYFIFLAFFSLYFSNLLLRPFKVIGDFCENSLAGQKTDYNPDILTDLGLLTTFCEWFFNIAESAKKEGHWPKIEVPSKFKGIHGPTFESFFFLRNGIYFLVIMVSSGLGVYILGIQFFDAFVDIAQRHIQFTDQTRFFIISQSEVISYLSLLIILIQSLLFCGLNVHLYSKVNVPAFGIFAALRSFSKGNLNARVHMLGNQYIRPYSRKINAYLKDAQAKISSQAK